MRRLLVGLSTLVLFLTFVPVVYAGTQGGCGIKNAGSLQAWENISTDHGDGDDNLWIFCSPGPIPNGGLVVTDFNVVPHALAGTCQSIHFHADDWNDCISSFTLWLPSSLWVLCAYQDASWGGQAWHIAGPLMQVRVNIPSGIGIRDEVSSLRMDNDGNC